MVDPSKISLAIPAFLNDLVLYADTVTFTVGAGLAGTQDIFPSSIPGLTNQYCRPLGIYTWDGGATYSDLGDSLPIGPLGSSLPNAVMPLFRCLMQVDGAGNINFVITKSLTTSGSYDITISYVVLAVDTPGILLPAFKYKGKKVLYTSRASYRKIATRINDVISTSSLTTTAHVVGGVPLIQFWYNDGAYNSVGAPWNDPINNPGSIKSLYVDAANIYAMGDGTNLLVRAYYGQ